LDQLPKVWSDYGKNTQSVGELWLGFLSYYTEKFDWSNHVITIRDDKPLTRRAKNWIKSRIAIEDPFELSHNLGAGVSQRMGLYIMKCFIRARSHFGYVIDLKPMDVRLNIEFFFNPKSLVDGQPPMDRNCYLCFKIGHMTKECPNAEAILSRKGGKKTVFSKEGLACFKCNEYGHLSRDCTSIKCFKCNQMGHISRDCPQNNIPKGLRNSSNVGIGIKSTKTESITIQQLKPNMPNSHSRTYISPSQQQYPVLETQIFINQKSSIQITPNGGANTLCLTIPQQQQQIHMLNKQQQHYSGSNKQLKSPSSNAQLAITSKVNIQPTPIIFLAHSVNQQLKLAHLNQEHSS